MPFSVTRTGRPVRPAPQAPGRSPPDKPPSPCRSDRASLVAVVELPDRPRRTSKTKGPGCIVQRPTKSFEAGKSDTVSRRGLLRKPPRHVARGDRLAQSEVVEAIAKRAQFSVQSVGRRSGANSSCLCAMPTRAPESPSFRTAAAATCARTRFSSAAAAHRRFPARRIQPARKPPSTRIRLVQSDHRRPSLRRPKPPRQIGRSVRRFCGFSQPPSSQNHDGACSG